MPAEEKEVLVNDCAAALDGGVLQAALAALAVCVVILPWVVLPAPALPLVIVLGIAALALGIREPSIVLAIFLSLSLLRLHEIFPVLEALHLPLLFFALAAGGLAYHVFLTRSRRPFWSFELGALVVFFGIVTIGNPFADSSSLAWDYWISIFSKIAVMTLLIAWIPQSPRDYELLSRAFIIGGVAVATIAIYNKYAGIGLVNVTRVTIAQAQGSLRDPNELTLVLMTPLAFSLGFLTYRSGAFNKTLATIATPIILLAVVFAQSRGGLLATLALLAVFGLRLKSKLLLGAVILVAGFGLFEAMGLSGRAVEAGGLAFDESALDRLRAWKGAIEMALAHPLNGVGLANFSSSLPAYEPGKAMVAHSTWFGVLGETGIPGFAVFAVLVGASIRSAVLSRRLIHSRSGDEIAKAFSTGLVAAFAAFFVAGSFLTHGFTWPLYILLGLAASLSRFARATPARSPVS